MSSLVILVLAIVLGIPALAIAAFAQSKSTERKLDLLQKDITNINSRITEFSLALEKLGQNQPEQENSESSIKSDAPADDTEPLTDYLSDVTTDGAFDTPESPTVITPPLVSVPFPSAQGTSDKGAKSLEEALTSRWLVWLGALAIALGGTFLVKYAIDNGYLGPVARVSLGFTLGLGLAVTGEWFRQRPLQRAVAAIRVNYVPPALTASGLFIAFVSIYAAYGLYDLLPPLVAFTGLAFVALLGVGLSLLQGPFVALMGVLGAFTVPVLVTTPNPSPWTLFPYLFFVEAASLAVARYTQWWWFAFATLLGAMIYPPLWMLGGDWKTPDDLPLGIYLLLTASIFFALRLKLDTSPRVGTIFQNLFKFDIPDGVIWCSAILITFETLALSVTADFSVTALVVSWLVGALYFGTGRTRADLDALPFFAAVLALSIAAIMPLPAIVIPSTPYFHSPYIPSELQRYASIISAFATIFGFGGFAVLWGSKRPGVWAGVSALVPLLLLAIAYYRIVDFGVDYSWAMLTLALAAINTMAVERVERYRTARGLEFTLGFYAAAVVACMSLAAAMTIRQAWLTVALSVQLPALAWLGTRIRARSIQIITTAVALAVLTRLVLNHNVLNYPVAQNLATSWVIYGYGIPTIMFLWSARMFRKTNAEALIKLLEGGGLAFFVLLISLQLRLVIAGSLDAPRYSLLEQSLQSISWLSIGTALALYHRKIFHVIAFYGSVLLLGLASFQVVFRQILQSNPLWTHEFVGLYPIINVLLLAYGVPAVFAFAYSLAAEKAKKSMPARVTAITGFVLLFVYLSLEVTHAYRGPSMSENFLGDAEIYTYSLVWLVYAAILLGIGILMRKSLFRYTSLTILIMTTLKVFLIDMSGLTGLFRVASFLGLGLSLVGIGYLYQRFVFQPAVPQNGKAQG